MISQEFHADAVAVINSYASNRLGLSSVDMNETMDQIGVDSLDCIELELELQNHYPEISPALEGTINSNSTVNQIAEKVSLLRAEKSHSK